MQSNPELFRTVVDVKKNSNTIRVSETILSLGSCFSEHIAHLLKDYLFNTCINPTGILYNPASIAQALRRVISGKQYSENDLFFHNNQWKSFDHHSEFNSTDQKKCLDKINSSLNEAHQTFLNCKTLILTFGTAFIYRKKDTGAVVANCHRLPHDTYTRFILPIDDIVSSYKELFQTVYKQNSDVNIILTISPVRHLRDNPHENQVSKSHLFAAAYQLEETFDKLYYFPSYEIIMDELRDYRFYNEDMVHPSNTAIKYIWGKFTGACLDDRAQEFIQAYRSVYKARKHKVTQNDPARIELFADTLLQEIGVLEQAYPEVSFQRDRDYFSSLIQK